MVFKLFLALQVDLGFLAELFLQLVLLILQFLQTLFGLLAVVNEEQVAFFQVAENFAEVAWICKLNLLFVIVLWYVDEVLS